MDRTLALCDLLMGRPAGHGRPAAGVLLCPGTPRIDDEPPLETIELDGSRPATHAEI